MSATEPIVANIDPVLRAANQDIAAAANLANAVTGIYGISGTGKSNLADTGAEACYETFRKITLAYVMDLGGFGTKRLALIRAGIMRVYDPRNHINPYETMELISLGAFPETLIDPERGYADPDVRLILPRRIVYAIICPQDHLAAKFESQAALQANSQAGTIVCPTCGVQTTLANAKRVDQVVVRHRMFADVGMRIYDSFTAMNEWGLADLQDQAAKGSLPTTSGGGSLLGAADALISGSMRFGSSSKAQYGFVQNRTYGWLSNIKKIPDQVMPAIATFHVESSVGSDESGGEAIYGPKIAGSARTGAVPGWLGNLIHTTVEPYAADDATLVYRAWISNHIDPRDPRKAPYVAKHRGTPIGMPKYLEDKPGAAPWSGFSLKVFYKLLNEQIAAEEAAIRTAYPEAPGIWRGGEIADADEVVGNVAATRVGQAAAVSATPAVGGGRSLRRAGGSVTAVAAPPAPAAPTGVSAQVGAAPQETTGLAGTPAGGGHGPVPSSPPENVSPSSPHVTGSVAGESSTLSGAGPAAGSVPSNATGATGAPSTTPASTAAVPTRTLRRAARPPV